MNALKILLEMRPALDGHAGIPQETRLLFSSLRSLPDFEVDGLIQSSTHVLAKGLPDNFEPKDIPRHQQINRLSRIVVSLEQKQFNPYAAAFWMVVRRILGLRERLTRFSATQFYDFLWRRLFAKTLPIDAFASVTSADFRVARVPWTAMHKCALITNALGYALYPRLDTSAFKVMIVETPYPGIVSPQTRLLVRYHDAIPLLMPHTISDRAFHRASHYYALRNNVRHGAYFACVSDATRRDLISIFPEVEERAVTIHNMISPHYFPEESSSLRVPEIIFTRRNTKVQGGEKILKADRGGIGGDAIDYLLMVSTIEPRKNHLTLLAAWEKLRTEHYSNLNLVVVGMLGWHTEPTGRWAGPENQSSIQIPALGQGKYKLEISVVSEIDGGIIDSMRTSFNGSALQLERNGQGLPCELVAEVDVPENYRLPFWSIKFEFSKLKTPRENGLPDDRRLAIMLDRIRLTKLPS